MDATPTAPRPACTCEWADYGGPEDGPSPQIVGADEDCPQHGRAADPAGWAYVDEIEAQVSGARRTPPAPWRPAPARPAAASRRALARNRRIERAIESCPEDIRMILQMNREAARPNTFLADVYRKLYTLGYELSDRQIEAVRRSAERDAEFAAAREAERAALANVAPLPTGRQRLVGEIVSVKTKNTPYGEQLKMIVRLADGNKVWGTVPGVLEDEAYADQFELKGSQVSFTATVERAQDDEHFGFFKRPSGARILTRAGS